MKVLVYLLLAVLMGGTACRRRRADATPPPEAPPPSAATEPAVPSTPGAAPAAKAAPPVNVEHLQAGPEFADLNNLIAGFYDRNKRLPNMQELSKMYAGPMPNPPGYKLVIDPKTKTVKAVR